MTQSPKSYTQINVLPCRSLFLRSFVCRPLLHYRRGPRNPLVLVFPNHSPSLPPPFPLSTCRYHLPLLVMSRPTPTDQASIPGDPSSSPLSPAVSGFTSVAVSCLPDGTTGAPFNRGRTGMACNYCRKFNKSYRNPMVSKPCMISGPCIFAEETQ